MNIKEYLSKKYNFRPHQEIATECIFYECLEDNKYTKDRTFHSKVKAKLEVERIPLFIDFSIFCILVESLIEEYI